MKLSFSIRDWFWLTLVLALAFFILLQDIYWTKILDEERDQKFRIFQAYKLSQSKQAFYAKKMTEYYKKMQYQLYVGMRLSRYDGAIDYQGSITSIIGDQVTILWDNNNIIIDREPGIPKEYPVETTTHTVKEVQENIRCYYEDNDGWGWAIIK